MMRSRPSRTSIVATVFSRKTLRGCGFRCASAEKTAVRACITRNGTQTTQEGVLKKELSLAPAYPGLLAISCRIRTRYPRLRRTTEAKPSELLLLSSRSHSAEFHLVLTRTNSEDQDRVGEQVRSQHFGQYRYPKAQVCRKTIRVDVAATIVLRSHSRPNGFCKN